METKFPRRGHLATQGAMLIVALMAGGAASADRVVDPKPTGGTGAPRTQLAANAATPAAGQAVIGTKWVRPSGAVLRREAKNTKGNEIGELTPGSSVGVLQAQATWIQVRTGLGQTGFVSKLSLTDVDPSRNSGGVRIVSNDSKGAGERSGVTSIRGLDPLAQQAAAGTENAEAAIADTVAMENTGKAISESEIANFATEGGITAP